MPGYNSRYTQLHGLIAIGVIETRPGRGAVVVDATPDVFGGLGRMQKIEAGMHAAALSDLLEVRESLEGKAAYLAAERASADDVAMIVRAASAIGRRPSSRAAYFKANAAFHVAIARASRNLMLEKALASVIGQVRAFRERLIGEVEANDDKEHREIVAAIRARDPARAQRAAIDHVRSFITLTGSLQASLRAAPVDSRPQRSSLRRNPR